MTVRSHLLVYATPDPRSFESEDTNTLPSKPQSKQAAAREAAIDAYIARVVSEAPKRSDEFLDRIAVLLRPRATRNNGTAWLSAKQYQSWEIKRHLQATESPGIHGTYGDEVAA